MTRGGYLVFLLICLTALSKSLAGTVNYNSQTGSVFQFSLINESSPFNTFLGNPNGAAGSPIPEAFTLSPGVDALKFSPGANLSVGAIGDPAFSWAVSQFSFQVSSLSNALITDLVFTLGGNYTIRSGSTSSASIFLDTGVFIEAFGNIGSLPTSKTASFQFPSQEWTSGSNQNWLLEWSPNLSSLFTAPNMEITKLNIIITPDIYLAADNGGGAVLYLNQMSVAVIPEPTTASLLLLGLVPLLRNRRPRSLVKLS